MDIYAKGQLSFLILNCLLDRDFYGLDIISEVRNRSNGRIELKKPSVYSNLTRMEKQGQVSSYMRSSDVGPNRKYYSVTEKGRNTYKTLKEEFERNHFDVFRDYVDEDSVATVPAPPTAATVKEKIAEPSSPISAYYQTEDEEELMQQDDFFDFSAIEEEPAKSEDVKTEPVIEEAEETVQVFEDKTEKVEAPAPAPISEKVETPAEPKQISLEQIIEKSEIKEEKKEVVKDDATFLPKNNINDPSYNQRIYDITKDFNKYRKRRSFAEDQMAIEESSTSFQEAEAKRQERLDSFKSSLLSNKGNMFEEQNDFEKFQNSHAKAAQQVKQETIAQTPAEEAKIEEKTDDGVFITERANNMSMFKTQKIEPPRLKINPNHNLPAPNRDTSIDPSHKEIISMLYSKSKGYDSETEQAQQVAPTAAADALYDYADLHDYYTSQHIAFKTYEQKNVARKKHNTNKLYLISSVITFALMCVMSGVIFAILKHFNYTSATTDFLYILLPALYLIEVVVNAINLRHTSWEPKPMWPQWLIWSLMILCVGIVFGLNFIFGMNASAMLDFATPLILPCALLLILFPIRYYIKRGTLVKFWK